MTNVITTPPVVVEEVEDANEAFEAMMDQIEDTSAGEPVNATEEFERLVEEITPEVVTAELSTSEVGTTADAPISTPWDAVSEAFDTPTEETLTETSIEVTSEVTTTPLAIPLNSIESTLVDTTARFSGANWFDTMSQNDITIVGCGGIGSWTALVLARLNVRNMYLYDADIVESVNMAGQMFGNEDIGCSKVNSVYHHVHKLCGYVSMYSYNEFFTESSYCSKITVGALDNMAARKIIFNRWKQNYQNDPTALFVDGRLSADELQIFVIKGQDFDRIKEYEAKWLFEQSEGEHTQCSFKQTTYMATMIASLIGNAVVNHCANLANPDAMFDLPFFINYNAEMMYFKTKEV